MQKVFIGYAENVEVVSAVWKGRGMGELLLFYACGCYTLRCIFTSPVSLQST